MSGSEVKFGKVIVLDDWGNVGYYLKAKKTASGTWSHGDQDQTHRLKDGDKLEVLWPDKTRTHEICKIEFVTNTVSDHGHEYDVKSERMHFEMRRFGAKLKFEDFNQIRARRAK